MPATHVDLLGVANSADTYELRDFMGSKLYHPNVHDLACALDWFQGPKLPVYDLAIFGAGPAGLSAAVYAASEGLTTGASLAKTLSAYLLERIQANPRIEVCTEVEIAARHGSEALDGITYASSRDGSQHHAETSWVFICIGGKPRIDWAKPGTLLTDESGYILTGQDLAHKQLPAELWKGERRPMFMETSIPGLFAAGDVRQDPLSAVQPQ